MSKHRAEQARGRDVCAQGKEHYQTEGAMVPSPHRQLLHPHPATEEGGRYDRPTESVQAGGSKGAATWRKPKEV